MKNGKFQIGLIGVGNIAQNAHIPAYLKQDDVDLVAACDLKLERAQQVKEKYGMKYAVGAIDELVAIDELDAVSVCTWNNAHAEAAIKACKAGKHVLCEKPMSVSVEDALCMVEAAEQSEKTFMMGFVYRSMAYTKTLKAIAESGRLGEIYYAKTGCVRRRGTPLGWFTDTKKSGGGPVIDIGVHTIDLTWYLMGKPEPSAVSACTHYIFGDYKTKGVDRWVAYDTDDLRFDTEDSANGLIRFKNGASMNFEVSWAINGKDTMYTNIYGDKGGALANPLEVYSEDAGYPADMSYKFKDEDAFYNEIRAFLDCARDGKEPIATARDGLNVQRMLNGIYDSARAGKEVSV